MFDLSEGHGRGASSPLPGSPHRPSQATLSPRRSKIKLVGHGAPVQSSLTRDGNIGIFLNVFYRFICKMDPNFN